MIRSRYPRRGGFTLIELLVVVSILAVLAALTAFGVTKVRSAQQAKTTDNTLTKLQLGLDQQSKVLADDIANPNNTPPAALITYCGGDKDRARAAYLYLKMKQEFPQTFEEARPPALSYGGVTLAPHAAFASTAAATATPGGTPEEAAVLLYLMLSEKAVGGVKFAADDVTIGAQTDIAVGGQQFRAFKDAWGKPITFVRFAQYDELQKPPFVRTDSAGTVPGHRDPFDMLRKVRDWSDVTKRNALRDALNLRGPTYGPVPSINFDDGKNKTMAVISSGPNATFENTEPTGTTDDVYGYRLRRQGTRGD